MSREIIEEEDFGSTSKSKINANFEELYNADVSLNGQIQLILADYSTAAEIALMYAANTHEHPISDISGLQAALDQKISNHGHGNISFNGFIGVTPNLPLITGPSGSITTGSFGVIANTFCQGNDSRLSDPREWSAATVDQTEAEDGISTDRKAWTSERMRQAAIGWYDDSSDIAAIDLLRPVITSQPSNISGAIEDSLSLNCIGATVSGTNLTVEYQWQRSDNGLTGWSDVVGETSSTISFNPAISTDDGYYRCLVPNIFGTEISDVAQVQINSDISNIYGVNDRGIAWDLDRMDHLFQDHTALTPVTAYGQPVGAIITRENGGMDNISAPIVTLGTLPNPGIINFGGSTGTWDSINKTMSNTTVGTNASYPRFQFSVPITVNKLYRVSGTLTGANPVTLRMGGVGSLFIATSGTFSYIIPCSQTGIVEFQLNGTIIQSTSFTNFTIEEVPGFSLFQINAGRRPIYSRRPRSGIRNILQYSEDFSNAYWNKAQATVSSNFLIDTAVNDQHFINFAPSVSTGQIETFTVWARAGTNSWMALFIDGVFTYFNLTSGTIGSIGAGVTASINLELDGFYRCRITKTRVNASTTVRIYVTNANNVFTYLGTGTGSIELQKSQFEIGSSTTAYQKVLSIYDVTESGVQSISYLSHDGFDDCLVTSAPVDFSNSDEMTISIGASRNTTTERFLVEHGNGALSGIFAIFMPVGAPANTNLVRSAGTVFGQAATPSNYFANTMQIITFEAKIASDLIRMRQQGIEVINTTADQGTGNYRSDVINLGSRNQTSGFFGGQMYSGFIINRILHPDTLIDLEKYWVADKSGIDL